MGPDDLAPKALKIIREAQVLVGGQRHLGYFPDHPGEKIILGKNPEETLKSLLPLAETRKVVILASGDPNYYGIGPLAARILGPERVVIHPNVTAAQAACARLKLAWQDAAVVSLHGRGWGALAAALQGTHPIVVYTDPDHSPDTVARFLLDRGMGEARLAVLENLGQEDERITWLQPEEAATRHFSPLNLVVILKEEELSTSDTLTLGMPEEALAHDAGMITKAEIRAAALAKLRLQPGLILWDVGAGSGSVGLEATLLLGSGRVFAIEKDPARAAMIRENRQRFGIPNLEVVEGTAPECLAGLPDPDRVCGGGGGKWLEAILDEAGRRLRPGGRVVVAATLLETLEQARNWLNSCGWQSEVVQLHVSRDRPLAGGTYLQPLNPVWLISGGLAG
jgi:precorrin-6Y C5,15-methyltransferase (decarboxylating)